MKKIKRLAAFLLAMVMMLAMAMPAMAASITIESTATDAQSNTTSYTYYEILKADLSGLSDTDDYESNGAPKPGTKVVYYVNNRELATALAALTVSDNQIFTVTSVTGATPARWNVELKATSISGAELATALNVAAVTGNAEATGTFSLPAGGTSVTKEDLAPGYYLIVASNGTTLVAQTLANVTIKEKNQYPEIDKSITEENGTSLTTSTKTNDVSIGDTVTYAVDVTIPSTVATKAIVITDKMYKGLTLNTGSLTVVNNNTPAEEITGLSFSGPIASEDGNYNVYTVTIPEDTVVANAGKTITLTYTATLNADALINDTNENSNTVKLTYDNYTTTEHKVITKTHKVEIEKVTEDGTTRLANVKFTLQNANNKYYVAKNGTSSVWQDTKNEFTTAADKNIVFDGLDAGTYTLTETDSAAGYNKLTAPITIVIGEDGTVKYSSTDPHNTATDTVATDGVITIKNQAGVVLPSTGGMGTTIFYIVGGILVIGAGVILVTRKRMDRTK